MKLGRRIITARAFVAMCCRERTAQFQPWTNVRFQTKGASLVRGLVRVSRAVIAPAVRELSRRTATLIRGQVNSVVREAMLHVHPEKAVVIDIVDAANAGIWRRAIEDVLKRAGIQAVVELTPPVQSVMSQGYSKTSIILGHEGGDPDRAVVFRQESAEIARRIMGLNDTTKDRVNGMIDQAIREEWSHGELAQRISEAAPDMASGRAMTIARTELNRAWARGSIEAMAEGGEVTHISVIGCQSREPESWNKDHYQEFMFDADGRSPESTCNISDVPIRFADQLVWHPNHTGACVPSRFAD